MGRKRKKEETEPSGYQCFWAGCTASGDYKAPRPGGGPRDYQWFCKEHITRFNQSWNFFDGMNEAEIYAFQKESFLGARDENWRVRNPAAELYGKMDHAFGKLFGERSDASFTTSMLPREIRDALSVLDLEHPCEKEEIKQQYRELVKKYHPDVNGNNSNAADIFKRINEAYRYLITNYCEM